MVRVVGAAGEGGREGGGENLENVFVGNAQVPSGCISLRNLLFGLNKKHLHCLQM